MSVALVRVDSRLVHGQVLEDWVPRLNIRFVLVADDQTASDPIQCMLIETCCPSQLRSEVRTIADAAYCLSQKTDCAQLILLRDIQGARALFEAGFHFEHLNMGNVHKRSGSERVTDSVYLTPQDFEDLRFLSSRGVKLEVRAISRSRPVDPFAA